MKRAALDEQDDVAAKRTKLSHPDRLSSLSDELLLRVLIFLPPAEICKCQRLSHRFNRLANDSSIWRKQYFDRFVRPRSSRLPGLRSGAAKNVHFTARPSRWLDEHHLVKKGAETDWKQQYKLRHNWSRGTCGVDAITVAEQPHVPPMVVQMHDSIIFTADVKHGLRAWPAKGKRQLLAQRDLQTRSPPTSMTVGDDNAGCPVIIIGHECGAFEVQKLLKQELKAISLQEQSDGVITSIAIAWPHLLTMSATSKLNLYRLDSDKLGPPIHSLKSHNVWTPLSVSLRSGPEIIMSIAYALPTYLSGWTVGVQEIKLDQEGHHISSRTASAIDQHYRPLAFAATPMMPHLRTTGPGLHTASEFRHIHSKPNSLSYTHPYLLVSHPDNTLTLYLVFSDADALTLSTGSRLWGHTSSVSGAHVGGRGKAISVNRRGDELRIWELEGGFTSDAAKKRLATGDVSVRIKANSPQSGIDVVNTAENIETDELQISRGWIGFDAENVAVLREESNGKQALVVYDFT